MYDLIIGNGLVVSPSSTIRCDIGIKEGKIAALGTFAAADGKRWVDAQGKYVLPGVVEAHMHAKVSADECQAANDFYDQSIAAAFGGVTTFMDFGITKKGVSVLGAVKDRLAEMEISAIDYAVHGRFVESTPERLEEIGRLIEYGVPTFKLFMTYGRDGIMCDDETLLRVFKLSGELGGMPMLHCESDQIFEYNVGEYEKTGDMRWANFPKAKPVLCEAEAFARACYLAENAGAPIIVVHTTNEEALATARRAHAKGMPVYVETCPHYLTLFDDLYEREDGYLAICAPPLRTPAEAEALWRGMGDGAICLVGSDDCTFDLAAKTFYLERNPDGTIQQDFSKATYGIPGIEVRLPILLSEGVNKGRLTINQVCALTSANVAKVYGCYPRKGVIAPGADADLVVVDMEKEVTLSKDILHSNIEYCMHEGMQVKGYPVMTVAGGKIIVEDGQFKGEKGAGRFIPRALDPDVLAGYIF